MRKQTGVPKIDGLSLIELMVTMVVSLFLMSGVVTVYLGVKSNDKVRSEISEMDENGRNALMLLRDIISHAGYRSINNLALDTPFYVDSANIPNPKCRGGAAKLVSYPPILSKKTRNSVAGKRDTLVTVHIADSPTVAGSSGGLLVADCQAGVIPAECSSDPVAGLHTSSDSRIYNYLYINTPSKRRVLTCMGSRGGSQPLAENIENMQFLYGVSSGGSLVYRNADSVTANAEWDSVVTVRVALLVRSENGVLNKAESKSFLLLDEKITTPKDKRIYKAYTTTIVLPNRLDREL
ncbi:MAG: hypothetical protein CSB47_09055 [Proteobacteria bacterium]|nr:MAG: hypothetical protein CSB47_09055 [Pseudomonadota bacterium]